MKRIVPIVLAVALFMETMDATVIATSLPVIAADLGTSPIALKLALTSYYVSLAIFIPVSGRLADRFGAKNVFRLAIFVFMLGSLACALSSSLEAFVASRFLQGVGGAMMTPVGRLLLVRAVPKADLVGAMAWFTIPALIGPLIGPPLGGAIATYSDWRWIFLINLPIGVIGIVLATRFLPFVARVRDVSFDWPGFVLSGFACAGLVFGFSVVSLPALPPVVGVVLIVAGTLAALLYVRHARRAATPILKLTLLKIPTLRVSIVAGTLFRVGTGSVPFLLPLMLQIGYGYSALQSGLVASASMGGAILMKFLAKPVLKRFGFRSTLVVSTVTGGALIVAIGLETLAGSITALVCLLLVGGFFRSLFFTGINTLGFADLSTRETGDATAMMAATQQVSIAFGVALAGTILEAGMAIAGGTVPQVADFAIAFTVAGLLMITAAVPFLGLSREAGDEVAGRSFPAA
ncbi:MFS transporter [Fulvimarina sp. 2208YS6-2-32]|uniref:MFS transporter n=1 Tax=Fulvimarina uroteuthidis TaxID=3098149 RepID=A0ABU5I3L2_9HYPH|nr:MFS transporter [Fulvimarina sp. 2208YS6-2-32]MDY8109358.1 MFS transporter [Fulvimarina sp. 2208YS6-2-32]